MFGLRVGLNLGETLSMITGPSAQYVGQAVSPPLDVCTLFGAGPPNLTR
jgi:hypothetical protein